MASARSRAALALGLLLLCSCIVGTLQQQQQGAKPDPAKQQQQQSSDKQQQQQQQQQQKQQVDLDEEDDVAEALGGDRVEAPDAADILGGDRPLAEESASQARPAPAVAAVGGRKAAPKKVKVVDIAPEAEVENDDDIDPKGACAEFIPSSSCKELDAGEGRLAECISQAISEAEASDGEQDTAAVPEKCEAEVYNFFIKRSKNINANVPLAKACKADAVKLCNNTWFFGEKAEGRVIACLREQKGRVSAACKAQLTKAQVAAARDYRADPALEGACHADAEKLCAGVKEGGGRKQACLRDNHLQVSWECGEQLFRQELEADDDLRLSVRLYARCLADKKRFCADADAGHAGARDCLVEHRNDDGFSDSCREELDTMIERRVRDFRLDARLRRHCQSDIVSLCGTLDDAGGDETDVNICLQDYVGDIRDESCRALVKQYQALAAQDIRFDVPLAEACFTDRAKLCANVPPGSARVIRCLQSQRDSLTSTCRATLFDEEVRFSENIDFQWPMKRACEKEIAAHCAKVPHGNARVIRCLQDNKGKKDFGLACLQEVAAFEQRASSDYRLNHRLRTACRADVGALCKGVCKKGEDQVSRGQVCGGAVLRCLTERQDDIKSDACRKEVFYFQRMEVEDYRNDVILAAACRSDVESFCKDVKPGQKGGVHACLRDNRAKLSDACRREELLLEQAEAERIELRPGLLRACGAERALFCQDVAAGNGRVFRCLADKLADADFGQQCRFEVINKLKRRQANWKLDPPLRKACRADVSRLCAAADAAAAETGLVYKCLVSHADTLDPACRRELGRAIHMAFFIFAPGSVLTAACDVDVAEACLRARPNMIHTPGAVGACLADTLERLTSAASSKPADAASSKPAAAGGNAPPSSSAAAPPPARLSPECRALAEVSEPPNMARTFEESLSVALLESQLSAIESRTGATLLSRDRRGRARGVTLTGWSAVAGMAALVVLLLAAAGYGWRRYTGGGDAATVVLKAQARAGYKRVSTSGV